MAEELYKAGGSGPDGTLPDVLAPDKADQPKAPSPSANAVAMQRPQSPRIPFQPPPGTLDYGDFPAVRQYTLQRVADAMAAVAPVRNDRFTLAVRDVRYTGQDPTVQDEERAVKEGRTLSKRLVGRYVLTDNQTGEERLTQPRTLMNVPWMTRGGHYLIKGVPYALLHQFRMDPGIYARVGSDGKAEAQINVEQGTGNPFKVQMDPDTGTFYARIAGKGIPLYHLLHAMGVGEPEMEKAWGRELLGVNRAKRPHSAAAAWMKRAVEVERRRLAAETQTPPESVSERDAVASYFRRMKLDAENTRRIMGRAYDSVTPDALLHASARVLRLARGEEEPDSRDNPSNQRVFDEGDHFATYLKLDRGGVLRTALWKLRNDPERLARMPSGLFDQHVSHHVNGSGLAQVMEQINPVEAFSQAQRITRLGEGAIESIQSAPMDAREVQPGYVGFIDAVRGPESLRVGLDMFLARASVKGPDNRLYTRLRDVKTGEQVWLNPVQVEREFIANPGTYAGGKNFVAAMSPRYGVQYIPRDKLRYELVSGDDLYSANMDTIPLKSGVKGMRMLMGCVSGSTRLLVKRADGSLYTGTAEMYAWEAGDEMQSVDDSTGLQEWRPVRAVRVSTERRPMYRVTLRSGRSLEATDNHRWVTMGQDGRFEEIPTGSLTVGTDIPRLGAVEWPAPSTLRVHIPEGVAGNAHPASEFQADFEAGWIFGLYLAEGSQSARRYGANTVAFAATVPEIIDRVIAFFGGLGVCAKANRKKTYVPVNWTMLARWLDDHFSHGAFEKRISAEVMGFPLECRKGILAGYLAGDGGCAYRRSMVRVAGGSRSKALVEDLGLLCSSLGMDTIQCRLVVAEKPFYKIEVRAEDVLKLPRLGHPVKDARLRDAPEWTGRKTYHTLPHYAKVHQDMLAATKRGDNARCALYSRQLTKGKVRKILGAGACVWADSPVIWDKVHRIETIPPQDKVYDFDLGDRVFAVGNGIVVHNSKFLSHALPVDGGEAPLVQTPGRDGTPSAEFLGRYAGAVRAEVGGEVVAADANGATVRSPEGEERRHEWYSWMPFARKTYLEQKPAVKVGDKVEPGALLATSNYTDASGQLAVGRNLRVAMMPYRGYNFEDAIVVSEGAAKKMTSNHVHREEFEPDDRVELSRKRFQSLFPSVYTKEQLAKVGEDGVVATGSTVQRGDPLFLAVGADEPGKASMGRKINSDKSVVWEQDEPGVVREVVRTRKGTRVFVESRHPLQVGDKLCYDKDTEVLTASGWKLFAALTLQDRVACLDPATMTFSYEHPAAVHRYRHTGRMYRLETQQIDLKVTDNHRLFVQKRGEAGFGLRTPEEVFGKRVSHCKAAVWEGTRADAVRLHGYWRGTKGGGCRWIHGEDMPVDTYLMLLGMYLSEGCLCWQPKSGTYGLDIFQTIPGNVAVMKDALDRAGIKYTDLRRRGVFNGVRVHGRVLAGHFREQLQGRAQDKYIPDFVFELPPDKLEVLFRWLMWGDGHTRKSSGLPVAYYTSSPRLADDVQRLCLHTGRAANVAIREEDSFEGRPGGVDATGKRIQGRFASYRVGIVSTKTTPQVNHGHVRTQNAQTEEWVDYDGEVGCCTMPRGHVVYVRRNGKPVWCGNSGPHGNKGTVSLILPDDQMPRPVGGDPVEIILSPLGVPSRVNPSLVLASKLGKIAARTGKPYVLDGYSDEDLVKFTEEELKKHNVPDTEDLEDPATGKTIPQVGTGLLHIYKVQQEAESMGHAREMEGYSMDEEPSRGGGSSSKHIGDMELGALLAGGALEVLKDLKTIHGQANHDFWRQVKLGGSPTLPKTPVVYDKFRALIRSANVRLDEGTKTGDRVFAATDRDVAELAGNREIRTGETFDRNMKPIPGGLFDETATAYSGAGDRFAYIKLPEPLLNPLMEAPVRHILGMRAADLEDLMTGRTQVNGRRGADALRRTLEGVDLERVAQEARDTLKNSPSPTRRDAASKRLLYAQAMLDRGYKPTDFLMTRVPVIPPKFRRIVEQGDRIVVPDLNYMYRRLIQAREDFEESAPLGDEALADARAQLMHSYRALVGVEDPQDKDLAAKRVGGVLQQLLSKGSPKYSLVQRKVLGFNVDLSGLASAVPDPKLNINQVGIPEEFAWSVFGPFVIRRMVRSGRGAAESAVALKNRSEDARSALLAEMRERPVLVNRAPTLHRYGIMAFQAVPVPGRAIRTNPQIAGPFNLDYDGDKMSFVPPVSQAAVREAWSRMLPSANLLGRRDGRPNYAPSQEPHEGLYIMTKTPKAKPVRIFASMAEMKAAWRKGEIDMDDPVQIKE